MREAFAVQAEGCAAMGSPFTAALCTLLGERLDRSTATGRRVLDWPGDGRPSADSVPLRLCGALHALVLRGDKELFATYPPRADAPTPAVILDAIERHDRFIHAFLDSPPQTNETGRAGAMWPILMRIVAETALPLRLLEVGASAGLNLRMDGFAYELGGIACGDPHGPLRIAPEWRGDAVDARDVTIASREGCDIAPVDIADPDEALRLRAYCWPDQAVRRERLDAAIALATTVQATVVEQDALGFLAQRLAEPARGVCTVVYSTVAWQYLPPEQRAEGEAIIETAGARAGCDAPIAWARMEWDDNPPGAGLTLRLWPGDGETIDCGRADFHGRWVDWRAG